ncbi:MAG: hypothetical protein L3J71_02815 [Victivallaceae bacterium]|nr:hypothetical protein [Victivallaceae bacterium]
MKKSTTSLLYTAMISGVVAAAPTLSVLQMDKKILKSWPNKDILTNEGQISRNKIDVTLNEQQVKKLKEWTVVVENKSSEPAKLCFRLSIPCGNTGGAFWDGFKIKANITSTFQPKTKRYIFPAITYVKDGSLTGIGYAPMTISSRFERYCTVDKGNVTLVFDSYMALEPGQKDKIYFISQTTDATNYTELVEQIYLAYPKWFTPVKGADSRIFGMGGYFFSSDDNREYQMEEARRYGFDWEWYYNCYQKAGNYYPLQKFWENKKGYKSEPGSLFGKCDRPGTIADWKKYNSKRMAAGNKNAALFYYYLQQYCNSEMLKKYYPEATWQDKNGGTGSSSFGWAEEGRAQYAWILHSKLGDDIREQLGMVWRDFPIAGFALDCAIGDTKYYGPLLKNETGKAFGDDGQIFATEGIALAYNIDYTHKLPAKADGRKPASIINEFYTWLPMFYADAAIHEMTPFDRADLLAPRRLIAGQKPYYFWKGFRTDALLKWDELTPAEAREGITGFLDHTILSSFRFGIIPAIFYLKGFHDIKELNPTLKRLVAAGWRAAPYVIIDGGKTSIDPYAQAEEIWISRYGTANNSYIVLSAPDIKGVKGKAIIKTGKFGASGAIYADLSGKPVVNQIKANTTTIEFSLKNRDPLILKKIGVVKPFKNSTIETSLSVKTPGETQIAEFKFLNKSFSEIQIDKVGWVRKSSAQQKIIFEKAPRFTFIPNDKFIQNIKLVEKRKVNAVIAVTPEDLIKNPDAVKYLEIYYDYYFTRKWRPVHRLASMKPEYWNKNLRLPVVSPDSKKIKQARTVFVLGEKANKILLPETKQQNAIVGMEKNQQLIVGIFPGKNISTLELVKQLLNRMDEKYPFIGGVKTKWAIKLKLYGKTFKK